MSAETPYAGKLKSPSPGGLFFWRTLALLASLILPLCLAGGVQAVELLRENFSATLKNVPAGFPATIPGREGNGWTQPRAGFFLENPVNFTGVTRGMISFDIQRLPGAPAGHSDTLFSLLGADAKRYFTLRIQWASSFDPGKTVLVLTGGREKPYGEQGMGLWDPEIVLDRTPSDKQWSHIDLLWDDEAGAYRLFVNGRAQNVHPGTLDRITKELKPDQRKNRQKNSLDTGGQPRYQENPFSHFLKDVTTIRAGYGEGRGGRPGMDLPVMSYAVLDNLVVTVGEPIPENPDLDAPEAMITNPKTEKTADGHLLTWTAPKQKGVNLCYNIYRKSAKGGPLKLQGTTYDLSHADRNALESADYEYAIRAVYNGRESPREVVVKTMLDQTPPEPPQRMLVETPWGGEVRISWLASVSSDVKTYLVFRSEGDLAPSTSDAPFQALSALEFLDRNVVPGLRYNYSVAAEDKSGNRSEPTPYDSAVPFAGDGPAIRSVTAAPVGKSFRPGQNVTLTLTGQSGGTAYAQMLGLPGRIPLSEIKAGTYRGDYNVADIDTPAQTTRFRIVGVLTDAYGTTRRAGPEITLAGKNVLDDVTPPLIGSIEHDGDAIVGQSRSLVSGDLLTVDIRGEPRCVASFRLTGAGQQKELSETSPGVYTGSYKVTWGDDGEEVAIEGILSDEAGNESRLTAEKKLRIDTRVRVAVTPENQYLPADSATRTRVQVRAADANGKGLSGHEFALTLATLEDYTGVVGGGKIENRLASREDSDDLEVKWGGVTDIFGSLAASYTAGFAAKTALFIAKDLTTGDVGAGYLNTYVASTLSLQLTPTNAKQAQTRATIRMSATPGWLTADGRSKARVKAWLAKADGSPIANARVEFEVAGGNGSVKIVRGMTDQTGLAEADYRAGIMAGVVSVVARSVANEATASIEIELRSDAPAKIGLVAGAVSLPADGRSSTTLRAIVTDINDNPNKKAPIAFKVLSGSGTLPNARATTNDDGVAQSTFTAGRTPGLAVVEARYSSRPPSEEEERRALGTLFLPKFAAATSFTDRATLMEWLIEPGATVVKGQPLARVGTQSEEWLLCAPEDGVFQRTVKNKRDKVEVGESLGYVEIGQEVWKAKYVK